MQLEGKSLIGFATSGGGTAFRAADPSSGESLEPAFHNTTSDDVARAAQLAQAAFASYGQASGKQKGAFLRRIAEGLLAAQDAIVERAGRETALPQARLTGEMARTVGQLRLFATLVEEGSWVDARIDHGDPARAPIPKPDVRSMQRPLGPVVVFGASNFPLAFSVAGGDTAAALASGCPVIVKAHPAHPGTSELVGRVIQHAVRESNLHEGVFSLLFDAGHEVGLALVRHPVVKAVGFTGSRTGGRALMEAAAARAVPIPVFAEMSSVNPVVILPGALTKDVKALAAGLHGAVTLGVGQFCTNPGLVFVPQGADGDRFVNELATLIGGTAPGTMLTAGIRTSFAAGVEQLSTRAEQRTRVAMAPNRAGAALLVTDTVALRAKPELAHEVFGPSTVVVRYRGGAELRETLGGLEGQLTATVHATPDELAANGDLVVLLGEKAGRLLFGGFPTGVEVCHAMVHGGPYPATSDGRSTSVGTRAISRFARPLCWQNFPDAALPDELKEANPLGISRLVDGKLG
ncbi:-dioxovalerate dehydrogenase : NADP-dependent fatty aldehyde dehydrogenase OS=Acidobacterium capsulatum (strain ATCC 51196 / DSM 11244 / JCM 7670) GN=aldH PE=4 SV=1: Aldedh [Gemmata massiliana]|uniref:Aldehyde dehydrogenase domain-containing protein n=1 Tax=Gemmata massiliana TaxID=1210884 RepID=A0A6P2DDR7_9BACT|nr:aldehyde dehydrogenase (NADP(+)) [Gemmata massiliana]VTR97700.1 -dioxovalerate dehydrogenase : NADP-dependent fatty aldehyde dehydrogenase OS=Acidobacterium capsulatum (strain ATCC 51196 / DSM 11244 / JCM 7670) GN=aldH PE=4 SV=1: Aldedh [Gemmata massiliana]